MFRLVVCTTTLLFLAANDMVPPSKIDQSIACKEYAWSTPTLLAADENVHLGIRLTRVASRGSSSFLVGNDLSSLEEKNERSRLAVYDLLGDAVGRPSGNFTFAYPKAGLDAQGRLHLVWGEPQAGMVPASVREWMLQDIQSVWTASFDPATKQWSAPEQILSTRIFPLLWFHSVANLALGPDAELATTVLMPMGDSVLAQRPSGNSALVRLRLKDGNWDILNTTLPGLILQATIVSHGSSLFLIYASDSSPDVHGSGIFVARSSDDGLTWSSPILIDSSTSPIQGLVGLSGKTGIHIIWNQTLAGRREVIRHRQVFEDLSWTEAKDYALPARSGGEMVGVDGCGNLHLVYETTTPEKRMSLQHSTLGVEWSTPVSLFPEVYGYGASLSSSEEGQLLLTFIGGSRDKSLEQFRQTYVSVFAPRSTVDAAMRIER